jgi:hypothetical protein
MIHYYDPEQERLNDAQNEFDSLFEARVHALVTTYDHVKSICDGDMSNACAQGIIDVLMVDVEALIKEMDFEWNRGIDGIYHMDAQGDNYEALYYIVQTEDLREGDVK